MNSKYLIQMICICCSTLCSAQDIVVPQFITKGKIEYERRTNQHAFLDDNNDWDASMKKSLPKFLTAYYDLEFDLTRSIYQTGRETPIRQQRFWGFPDVENIVATSLDSNKRITQKLLFGETYLISDSLSRIQWKIGTEIRRIAGFDCRKAVGKFLDSIIVIAFYSDEIVPSGGPESFSGLPGMIMGLAIPRMHTTWYATKLEVQNLSPFFLAQPKKGKKVSAEAFRSLSTSVLKSWGDFGVKIQWQLLL